MVAHFIFGMILVAGGLIIFIFGDKNDPIYWIIFFGCSTWGTMYILADHIETIIKRR